MATKNKLQVNIRLSEKTLGKLKMMAKKKRRTVTSIVDELINTASKRSVA